MLSRGSSNSLYFDDVLGTWFVHLEMRGIQVQYLESNLMFVEALWEPKLVCFWRHLMNIWEILSEGKLYIMVINFIIIFRKKKNP